MADLDDDAIVVTLPAEGDGTVITKIDDGDGKKTTPEDPIEDLKGQFAQMTHRATAAETAHQQTARQLEETTRELQTTKASVTDSQLDTVLSGIQAAEAEAASAEKDYITAAEAGDFAAQARAQRKMAGAETRIQRLNEAKGDLEDQRATKPAPRTETRPAPRQQAADPVEAVIANGQVPPKSAAWLRAHPDCITDPKKNARMLAAHNLAIADDVAVESDEYFRRIEAGVENKPTTKAETTKSEASGKRPMSAAGPSGHAGGGMNGGGTQVTLTAREAASATDGTLVWNYDDPSGAKKFKKGDPIGHAEMARRKVALKASGQYDRTYSES